MGNGFDAAKAFKGIFIEIEKKQAVHRRLKGYSHTKKRRNITGLIGKEREQKEPFSGRLISTSSTLQFSFRFSLLK